MSSQRANNTLHGVTLETILTRLVQHYGWEELGRIIKIKCFTQDPSIKSSLTFLRRAPWAREMVERLYVRTPLSAAVTAGVLIVDDRSSSDYHSSLGTTWRVVTDAVMGGVSQGRLVPDTVEGRPCLRLSGEVSLENNGGFVQAALDLGTDALLDASGYSGVELDVCGNGESYNVHLRTSDTRMVWQSYRAGFSALPHWHTVRLPFAGFQPHRLDTPLDLRRLKRIGLVAIGRAFTADLCVGRVALYR